MFLFFPHSHLDSDQAVFGLMGKDIALGRAYPLFMYGQRYMFAVGSWLCAPLFALFGPNVTTLKLPMFAMNVACVAMLWRGLRREAWLGPWGTALAILPFAAASVVCASRIVEHQGGNIEPIFFLLLAFMVRERAIALGLTLGVAFLNREFALIGLFALLIMDAITGNLRPRAKLYAIACGVGGALVVIIRGIAEYTPGYTGKGAPLLFQSPLSGQGITGFFGRQLPVLLGAAHNPLRTFNVTSELSAGHNWLTIVLIGWALLAIVGATRLQRADFDGMSVYLVLVGIGQAAAFILLCASPNDVMLVRYILLCLCAWIGFSAIAWKHERLRLPLTAAVLALCLCNMRDHVQLAREYANGPPHPHENELLANALLERGVHYAVANFWIAYDVTWLTNERVIVSPPPGRVDRITRYHAELQQHRNEVVQISNKPCKHAIPLLQWHLCKASPKQL